MKHPLLKHLLFCLCIVFLGAGSGDLQAQSKPRYMVDKIAFYEVTEVQKTPFWCWAASIAMTLNAQGVRWRQEDVVVAVKGQLSAQTATAQEMSTFLGNWTRIDYDNSYWTLESRYYQGAPPLQAMMRSLEAGRPMIVTYRTAPGMEHAVVLYGANVLDGDTRLHSVYFFDPYTGKKGAALASDFRRNTTNTWDVRVHKR